MALSVYSTGQKARAKSCPSFVVSCPLTRILIVACKPNRTFDGLARQTKPKMFISPPVAKPEARKFAVLLRLQMDAAAHYHKMLGCGKLLCTSSEVSTVPLERAQGQVTFPIIWLPFLFVHTPLSSNCPKILHAGTVLLPALGQSCTAS